MTKKQYRIFPQPVCREGTLIVIESGNVNKLDYKTYNLKEICDLLNEQQEKINKLENMLKKCMVQLDEKSNELSAIKKWGFDYE